MIVHCHTDVFFQCSLSSSVRVTVDVFDHTIQYYMDIK
jgi:hypothetical protein